MKFSIVIPTYNRADRLPTCLNALCNLRYPKKSFEVIIADDGSEMPLGPIVDSFKDQLNLTLVHLSHGGVSHARNGGAAHATGQFLVFIDDDCEVHPDWLCTIEQQLEQCPDALVGGQLVNALKQNRFSRVSQLILDMIYSHYNRHPDQATFLAGANIAMSRKHYEAIGGCNTSFPPYGAEDRDLCSRWLKNGYPMRFAPNAIVYHSHPLQFRSFFNMYHCYGRGAYVFHQLRRRQKRGDLRIELRFYTNLTCLAQPILRTRGLKEKIFVAWLLIFWQLANLSGYLSEFMDRKFGLTNA